MINVKKNALTGNLSVDINFVFRTFCSDTSKYLDAMTLIQQSQQKL